MKELSGDRIAEAIGRQADLLQKTFDSMTDAVFILDAKVPPIVLECNRAASAIFGYDKPEILGRTTDFLHVTEGTLREFQSQLYSAVQQGRFPFQLQEFRMKRKDGSVFPSEHSVSQLLNDKGERTGWVSIVRDITERKRMEEEIRSLARFPSENPNPILRLDRHGTVLAANEASRALLQEWAPGIGQAAPKSWRDLVTDALSTGQSKNIDTEFAGKSYTFLVKPIMEADYVNLYGRDITERKRAEEALRGSEERYRKLFEEAMDGIALADTDTGILLDCNQALAALVGRNRTELIGHHQAILHPAVSDDSAFSPTFKLHATTHEGQVLETQVITGTGEIREVEIKASLLYLQGRKMLQGIFRDITERKRTEETLRRRAEELAALQATVLDITSAHDLSILLQTIVERAARLVGAPAGGMYLCDPEKQEARCVVSYNTPHDYVGTVLKYGEGAAGIVAQTGEPLVVDDYRTWHGRATVFERDNPFTAVLSVPMIWQGRVVGVIHVLDDAESRRFTQEDQELLTLFANHAAIAVERKQAEQKLRLQSEIAGNMFEGVVLVRASDDAIVYTNPRFEEMFGYGSGELIGKNIATVNAPTSGRSPEDVAREIIASLNEYGIWSGEVQNVKKDGTPFWCRANISTLESSEYGTIWVTTHEDITERKRAEEAYRAVVQHALQGLAILQENRIVFANQALLEMSGYSLEETLSLPPDDLMATVHPEDRERVWTGMQDLLAGRPVSSPQAFRLIRKDGTIRWVETLASCIEYQGRPAIQVAYADITERKRMEEKLGRYSAQLEELVTERTAALQATRERLEYVIASNPAVIYTGKPLADHSDWQLTYISERVVSMLGFEPREFVGHPEFWERHVHPEDLCPTLAEVPRLWKEGQHVFEYRFLHKDGTYRWIREEAKVVRDADGRPMEVNGYWTDITERKRLEEELAKSQRLATIGELAAMVGHDLRNPLTGIAVATYNLKKALGPEAKKKEKEMLQLIEEGIEHSDKIVSDLVEYSREIQLELTQTDAKSMTRGALMSMKIPSGIRVVDLTKREPKIELDVDRMRRVLVNLIRNAVDAMPKGGTLRIASRESNGDLELSITDTGVGITNETMKDLWIPLHTTKAKGMGLGLPVAKQLVEAHGGHMNVETKVGKGSTFTVTLPLERRARVKTER